ncbi:MAG: hypothetical protein E5V49_06430 [Mesorhizobium sp.]|nr:hypothetical protein EN848_09225 [bacterium M00.F.Ca.ET.205.01.1.1]TGU55854.1 hypothetical protein EN795_03800 [bacterium M00.F.Ca.ET.152.01.1.1]TGV39875.1 hypothetical protein EN829_000620 [Mesorhizobium sp. M00.F.Ca.ET.186.01.1.1]TGZ44855.1 hypothetical protein EN805_00620 [bacterium M00.F.Ca.ET.162.01.1.1]TIW61123.1 MAG: hypothetical protein E5V48_10615 [Mesorhizobium sp.]
MSAFRFAFLGFAACSIAALPSLAAAQSSDYVYCSNGIVCIRDPCPSGNALDLATGKLIKGVALNTTELPLQDRAAPDTSDKLQAGKLVVRGSIQHRGEPNEPPMLVVTHIERASDKAERKRCAAH